MDWVDESLNNGFDHRIEEFPLFSESTKTVIKNMRYNMHAYRCNYGTEFTIIIDSFENKVTCKTCKNEKYKINFKNIPKSGLFSEKLLLNCEDCRKKTRKKN